MLLPYFRLGQQKRTFSECLLVSCKAASVDSDGPPSLGQNLSFWKPGTSLRPPQGQPQASSTSTQVEATHTHPRKGTWVPGKAVALTAVLPPSCLCIRTRRVPTMQRRSGWQKGTPFLKHCPGLLVALCWAICTRVHSVSCSHSAFLSTFLAGSRALGIA